MLSGIGHLTWFSSPFLVILHDHFITPVTCNTDCLSLIKAVYIKFGNSHILLYRIYFISLNSTFYMLLIFIQILVFCPNNLITGFLCYDDGCHSKKYASNPARASQTPTAIRLASLNIVIDKMHFKGHTDQWCHQNCNPYSFRELDNVSWLRIGHLPNTLWLISLHILLYICVIESE